MLIAIINLLAGLAILMIGFRLLSDNIEKFASGGLKRLFSRNSKNHFAEIGIGAISTAILHSSAASTVMIVGFVNAGIMNLYQATAMIMGANIGTTITAQIVALGEFDISKYATILAIIGVIITMGFKKDKIKALGCAISGLGLVFFGLQFMSSSFTGVLGEAISPVLEKVSNPLILLLIGILTTALIQSSTAITTIIISMAVAGISIGNGGNSVLFVILGSNIGTCITALLSSVGASDNAKRASLIHLIFNVSGALLFFILLVCYKGFMEDTLARWFSSPATQIAMFHTFFNVVCTLIFIPLIPVIVKISNIIIKDKKKTHPAYIDDRFLKSAIIAIDQATKEAFRFGKFAMDTLSLSIDLFIEKNEDRLKEVQANIDELDSISQNLLTYLIKVSALQTTDDEEQLLSKLHKIINDFYREVEISDNMMKYTRSTINQNLSFSNAVIDQIKELKTMLLQQFDNVNEMYVNNKNILEEVDLLENKIDNLRSFMVSQHIERLNNNECSPANSGVFINLVSNLERAGDHLNFIAHTLAEK